MNIARYRAKLPGLLPAEEGAWRSQPGRPGETEPATRGCKFTRGCKKKPPELLQVRRLQSKTAATYSPTVTQYHRRDKA